MLIAGFPDRGFAVYGDTIYGSFGKAGQVHIYDMQDTVIQGVVLFAQASDASDGSISVSLVSYPSGNVITETQSFAGDVDLLNLAGPRTEIRSDQSFRLMVNSDGYVGEYAILPYVIDFGNELAESVLQMGSAVTGAIDPPGDVDRWQFSGAAAEVIPVLVAKGDAGLFGLSVLHSTPTKDSVFVFSSNVFGDSAVGVGGVMTMNDGESLSVFGTSVQSQRANGDYRLELRTTYREPEEGMLPLMPGDTVEGTIRAYGDVDDFALNLNGTSLIKVFVQSLATNEFDKVVVEVEGLAPPEWNNDSASFRIEAVGPDSDFYGNVSPALQTTPNTRLRVSGTWGLPRDIPYRLVVHALDSFPVPVVPTVVIVDSLQAEGDIDRYLVAGQANRGMWWEFQPAENPALPGYRIFVTDVVTGRRFFWGGRVIFQNGHDYLVHATRADWVPGTTTLPYTITLRDIDGLPETVSPVPTFGSTIVGESIDFPGDFDRFIFHADSGDIITVRVAAVPAGSGFFTHKLEFLDDPSVSESWEATTQDRGRVILGTGEYAVQLSSADIVAGTGLYEVTIEKGTSAPETVSGLLTLGDTVFGESMDFKADVDTFYFEAAHGTLFMAGFRREVSCDPFTVNCSIWYELRGGGWPGGGGTFTDTAAGVFSYSWNRLRTPVAGVNTFSLAATENAQLGLAQNTWEGPYSLIVWEVKSEPENVPLPATLADSIIGEDLTPGDIDEFPLSRTQGDVLGIGLVWKNPSIGGSVQMDLIEQESQDTVFTRNHWEDIRYRVQLNATGDHLLRVASQGELGFPKYGRTGPYTIYGVLVNVAPEVVPASQSIGTNVTGEAIESWYDMDEVVFNGTPGETVLVLLTVSGATTNVLNADLTDQGGALLGIVPNELDLPIAVTMPSSGNLYIRVGVRGDAHVGLYELQVVR